MQRAFPQTARLYYCVRAGVDDIHNEIKTLLIPIVHVVTDLISNSKRVDQLGTNGCKKYIKIRSWNCIT